MHIASERTFSMVKKIATENKTSLQNDTVCALLSCKLNCNRSAASFKPSKEDSSVARGNGGGLALHWPVNQNAEYGKYHFICSSETFFGLEWTKK